MEGFECGVVSAGTEGGHVENVTDLHSATIDTAMSLELAAVEVVGRKPDECGDLLAAHLSEFWQQGDQRERKYRYCVQVVAARDLMKRRRRSPEQMRDLRDATRLIITLSTKLRLGPKSRSPDNRRAASAGMRTGGPKPWETRPVHAEAPEAAEQHVDRRWQD